MGFLDVLDPGDVFGFGQDSKIAAANKALNQVLDRGEQTSNKNRSLYNQYLNKVQNEYGDVANKYNDYLTSANTRVYIPFLFLQLARLSEWMVNSPNGMMYYLTT